MSEEEKKARWVQWLKNLGHKIMAVYLDDLLMLLGGAALVTAAAIAYGAAAAFATAGCWCIVMAWLVARARRKG